MRVAPLFDVKNRLSQYVKGASRRPVIITRNGRPCAAIVGLDGDDLEAFLLAHHPAFLTTLDRAYDKAQREGVVGLAALEREVSARERRGRRKRRKPGVVGGSR